MKEKTETVIKVPEKTRMKLLNLANEQKETEKLLNLICETLIESTEGAEEGNYILSPDGKFLTKTSDPKEDEGVG